MEAFVLDQLVYFGFLQGAFLLGSYALSPKWRKNINGYLVVLIVVLMIGLTGRAINASGMVDVSYRFIALSEYATFLFGATVYLFTRSSLKETRFTLRNLIHYLPGVGYILVITFYYILAPREVISARFRSGELFWAVVLFMGAGLVVNIAYWVASYRLFRAFRQRLGEEVSYAVKTRFFHRFLLAIGGCLVCWLVIYLVGVFGQSWMERSARPFIWMSIAFIMYFIAYYGMKEPELFRVAAIIPSKTKKYAQSRLSNQDLDRLKEQLDQLMLEKKPYLNRNLLKSDLAELLGVNNPEVARLLNERIGMNFFEYINYYRIKEFIALAKTEKAQNLTFFGLAQEAGFNSKTTFNNAFKKLMGTSPKEYFTQEAQ
ncbi:MAG: helix-turn-helix domain-containing protein [Bacteroidota bacterium]